MLVKPVESPLDFKQIQPVNPKVINSEYSLEGLMLKLMYFGHLMRRAGSLEKTLMLGKIEVRRIRVQQRMRWLNGITDSMVQTPGDSERQRSQECCSLWVRRVRHDLVTEQQQVSKLPSMEGGGIFLYLICFRARSGL